ncbi:hypothetical protein DP73_03070 [Desulfosporosinus sp. HMP52]|uniref:Uma2 family endonuclease n=1 Tax=Desulfosporosinus sp. HMP52 TaxID=1487923 RepID=UPI00051FF27E|nr:Uma2 family endonuclease [Desulfosporosinus sp. HMP52]KGK91570.1 hypothetical protein DP73_03070 [Desulfosporosinus sp. HMP52]
MPSSNDVRKYTYTDYLLFPDDERWEIIDGVPYMQSAPSWQHQSISRELLRQFANFLLGKPCEVFAAPFDLGLSEAGKKDKDITDVYQPDLVVICDKNQLKGTGYFGVPDLVIEILSPSTAKKDRLLKFNMYEKFGVKEYWIVEPDVKLVSVFILQGNKRYGRPELYTELNDVKVSIFPDLIIKLNTVFEF